MRKLILLLLAMAIFLAACGGTPADPAVDTTPETTEPTPVPTEATAAPTETEPGNLLPAGYYLLYSMTAAGQTAEGDAVMPLQSYIQIQSDRTGTWSILGQTIDLKWDDTRFILSGISIPYTAEKESIVLQTPAALMGSSEDGLMTYRYNGDILPEEYTNTLKSGYFVASSIGHNGDVTFFGTPDPENGYLILEEAGTGFLSYGGTEQALTWDAEYLYWGEQTLPYFYQTYFDPELGYNDALLTIFFTEESVSLVMRPVDEPEP